MANRPVPPNIAAHRLLGDGRSAALLRPDGEIDWWCAPDVDSPPVLWSLLDPKGAAARFCGVRYAGHEGAIAGPVARTALRHAAGRLECRDALLRGADAGSALVRLVRNLDADLDVAHELALGGFDAPWAAWTEGGAVLPPGPVRVAGGDPEPGPPDGRWLRTRLAAPARRWAALVVSFDPSPLVEADPAALSAALDEAEAKEAELLAGARLPRRHAYRATDALAVLGACTYARTGAVIASPTTSLPEAPGADRQFDYRYTWLRDSSLAVSVAALLGRDDVAARALSFVHHQTRDLKLPSGPMTDVRGETVPAEREVPGVAGWAGSLPVRVGNAAADQVQYDALGTLVEAVSVHLQMGGALDERTWRLVAAVADHVAEVSPGPSNGTWEFRTPRPLVSEDVGCWLVLDRALWIARFGRPLAHRRHWRKARATARARVLGALLPDGGLPQSYGEDPPRADATALAVVLFRMLDRRDPRASRLVDATIAALGAGPYLYRYEPGGGHDDFSGTEGAFVPMSWWAVSALAAVGRVDEAVARADALAASLPRLQAEEVDPATGDALGNVPLVWSHMEAARALYLLDAAERRRRYGAVGLAAWRVWRYVVARQRRGAVARQRRGAVARQERRAAERREDAAVPTTGRSKT